MILGIGTDIFAASRLAPAALAPEDPFFRRAYTPAEQRKAQGRPDRRQYLAGRFAAKEAIYKSISSCGTEFRPGEIQITDDPDGRPHALLLGGTKAAFEDRWGAGYAIHLSISHEDGIACAFAITEQIE